MKSRVFLSFIIAGGVSNVIDRIFRGYVLEFIDFKFLPVLNIADIFIFIGWLSFIGVFTVFSFNEMKENRRKRKSKLQDNEKKEN